ncbi:MAG: DNA primase [Magnetococcales bacterium]|nr:DNA primase [Magnetococcales bacterium]
MGYYPDSFLEEIRNRIDLLEVIGRHVTLKKAGVNWQGLCPFHNEKTPSFSVHPDKGIFKCFGCGAGGDAFGFVMKIKGVEFPEAIEELAGEAGLPLPETRREDPRQKKEKAEREQLLALVAAARDAFQEQLQAPNGRSARDYLQKRGLQPETIERFGLGFAPPGWRFLLDRFGGGEAAVNSLIRAGLAIRKESGGKPYDRFRERIIFPINDLRGRCVGFGGRALGSGEPKYLNSPETPLYHKGEILYGLDLAQESIRRENRAVVVEGYMDLIALADRGITNVAATLGTAFTLRHMQLLWRRSGRLVFCFDGDNAGRQAAWRALEQVLDGLQADRHAHFLFLPQGEDPDDVVSREGAEGFKARLDRATPLMEFLYRYLKKDLNLEGAEGQAALVHRAGPLLAKVADPLLKTLFAEELGKRLGLSGEHVVNALGQVRRKPPPTVSTPIRRRELPMGRPVPEKALPGPMGRDYEKVLLAQLLRFPNFAVEYEEDLGGLVLKNRQFSAILSELLELGYQMEQPLTAWPLERFSQPVLADLAQGILRSEELHLGRAEEEFIGCLRTILKTQLKAQKQQLREDNRLGRVDDDEFLSRNNALCKEERRINDPKSWPVL